MALQGDYCQMWAYCIEDPRLIENYELAKADNFVNWVVHHRDEIRVLPSGMVVCRSREDLKENGRYYHCPANELIFLTITQHRALHNKYMTKDVYSKMHKKGYKLSSEAKMNMSLVRKNKPKTEFGKKFYEHFGVIGKYKRAIYQKELEFYKKNNKCSWEVKC